MVKLHWLWVAAIAMTLATAAGAQTETEPEAETESDGQMSAPEAADPANDEQMSPEVTTSARVRQQTMGGLNLAAGFFVSAIPGYQIQGYYQLNPDISVALFHSAGSLDLKDSLKDEATVRTNTATLGASMTGVMLHYFLGNSFYVTGGLGQRQVKVDLDLSSTVIDYGLAGEITADTLGLILAIGNQWQFDPGFTIGCEWIGYTTALSSDSSSNINETGAAAGSVAAAQQEGLQSLREDAEDTAELIGKSGTTRLLMVSVGWAF